MAGIGTGGCRCGAVRYACSAAPIGVSICYCRDCRQASGGPFCVLVIVPSESVAIAGPLGRYVVQAESGRAVERAFCARCGSPILASTCNVFTVTLGSLDDAGDIRPTMAIWLDHAPPWCPVPDGAERFHQNPPISSGAPAGA